MQEIIIILGLIIVIMFTASTIISSIGKSVNSIIYQKGINPYASQDAMKHTLSVFTFKVLKVWFPVVLFSAFIFYLEITKKLFGEWAFILVEAIIILFLVYDIYLSYQYRDKVKNREEENNF